MSNPKFLASWHGVRREEIDWQPRVEPELCIGCGLCVLDCGHSVYKYDFESNKAVVVEPLNCKVGCVTCANTCPAHAISFPSLSYLHMIIKKQKVLASSKEELKSCSEKIKYKEKTSWHASQG